MGELQMVKIKFAHACSLASVATVMLGTVSLPGSVLAQNAAVTNSNTATSNTSDRSRNAVDPGVRGGNPGAGGALPGLSAVELAFFNAASDQFQQVEEVVADGLGPRFNLDSCSGCHLQPSVGGSSPAINPQVAVATAQGAKNVVPSFVTANGPVREARFVRNPNGTPDGGVHALFVVTGRSDAPGCNIRQPDFAAELARKNVIFRIPTPTFGLGLVESVSDAGLEAALAANAQQKRSLGISGRFNRSGNDGTITRFGWKAQNKSLLIFAGEAYNVEMGVTNDLFPNERENDPNCQFKAAPNNTTPLTPPATSSGSPAADYQSDVELFAAFMRLLAPPTPASSTAAPVAQTTSSTTTVASAAANVASVLPSAAGSPTTSGSSTTSTSSTASTTRGRQVFANVGCQACHVKSQITGKSPVTALSNVTFEPLSDFALHDMGTGLDDGVSQGNANGREFRTAPLWGVGQRIFFLHDGRTSDLVQAIRQHASSGSEANEVVENYNLLPVDDKQSLLNYLRSL
jgi:mono/diheme cytochrome c family protein